MRFSRSELIGPLARKLGLSVFLISIFVTILTSSLYLYIGLKDDIKHIDVQLDEVKELYLPSIASRLWVADIDSLKLDLGGMLHLESIEYLAISEQGQTVIEMGTNGTIIHRYPIVYEYQGELQQIGELTIGASTDDVYQMLYEKALTFILLVAFQTFLAAGLVLLLVSRRVTQHLGTISTFARDLGLSNLNQQLVLDRSHNVSKNSDELDILVDALLAMQKQLAQSVMALKESEENLALTLDCIGDAVIATDSEGLITRMNPVAERMTGWAVSKAIGCPVSDVFPIVDAETLEPAANPVHQALTTGNVITLSNHTTLLAKNSVKYQIADSAAPIRNGNTIIGAILVFHDVTEQYQIRQQLLDSQKRLKLHIDQTPLAAIEYDRNFRVTNWNSAAERIFGYRKEEVMGLFSWDLLRSPEGLADMSETREKLLSNQTVIHQIDRNSTKGGGLIDCEWFSTPLVDEDGQVIGVASLVDDISSRVQAEEKNRQQQLEQKRLLDNLLDAVITVDEDGAILSFNTSAEKLFGFSEEEVLDEHFQLILPSNTADNYQQLLNQSSEGFDVEIIDRAHETVMMNKAGEQFPVRLSITTTVRVGSEKMLFIASIHDLCHEKKNGRAITPYPKDGCPGEIDGGYRPRLQQYAGYCAGLFRVVEFWLIESAKITSLCRAN